MSSKEITVDQEDGELQQIKLGPNMDPRLKAIIDPATGKPLLYPRKLFEMMARNYDSWLQVLNNKKFSEEEGFLPFPKEENGGQPIFSYSLLEALEKANSDFAERLNSPETLEGVKSDIELEDKEVNDDKGIDQSKRKAASDQVAHPQTSGSIPPESLLKEAEISYLRNRISDMIKQDLMNGNGREGFNLYDTKDEEGLHEGNCGFCDHDDHAQDDYDIEEVDDDDFLYDYQPTHHIEVELNTAPTCDVHGNEECDCPIYDDGLDDSQDGPSCEFTFEYDYNGKLVPTYSNVEEKLRLMNLQSELKAAAAAAAVGSTRLPAVIEPVEEDGHKKNKKKKKKKKKQDSTIMPVPSEAGAVPTATIIKLGPYCCLFCEYEAFYGTKPRQLIKSYELKLKKELQRRQEIRRKLENAKLKALKKQQEMRQKQVQQLGQEAVKPFEETKDVESVANHGNE